MGLRISFLNALFTLGLAAASVDSLERAQKLYDRTNFTGAVEQLLPLADGSAPASELLGQSYYMLGEYKQAGAAFEHALALDSSRSEYFHWLGRTYGRRAETSFAVFAAGYASKARLNFEKAVALDPSNLEAVSDLFEFYLQAPGILGGGFDKAARMAAITARYDAAEGNFAFARLAEERKDYSTAEALLRRAIALAPRHPGRILDLAKLLAQEGRFAESDAAFAEAHRIAPQAPRVFYQQAATYIKYNRKSAEARELLTRYLTLEIAPEDTPKSEARKLLRQLSGS